MPRSAVASPLQTEHVPRHARNEKAFRTSRTQIAPLSLHDVLQVTSLPFMQYLHTSTH